MTIPAAFDVAAAQPADIGSETRRAVRDKLYGGAFLNRCVRDIRRLLLPDEDPGLVESDWPERSVVQLWDDAGVAVEGGTNYEYEVDF